MEKAGKKAYMSRIVVLAGVIAVLCVGGEKVCFGLVNESPWPMFGSVPTWWTGLVPTSIEHHGLTPAIGIH